MTTVTAQPPRVLVVQGGEASARMRAAVFLSKPFGLDELVGAVERVLRSQPA